MILLSVLLPPIRIFTIIGLLLRFFQLCSETDTSMNPSEQIGLLCDSNLNRSLFDSATNRGDAQNLHHSVQPLGSFSPFVIISSFLSILTSRKDPWNIMHFDYPPQFAGLPSRRFNGISDAPRWIT